MKYIQTFLLIYLPRQVEQSAQDGIGGEERERGGRGGGEGEVSPGASTGCYLRNVTGRTSCDVRLGLQRITFSLTYNQSVSIYIACKCGPSLYRFFKLLFDVIIIIMK